MVRAAFVEVVELGAQELEREQWVVVVECGQGLVWVSLLSPEALPPPSLSEKIISKATM